MSFAESYTYSQGPGVELPVPHYWQLNESFGLSEYDALRVCALVCVKTVLDYKVPNNIDGGIPLSDIIVRASEHNGKTKNGWAHSAEVATIKDYGINAWRRDWNITQLSSVFSQRKEKYDQAQLDALNQQRFSEAKYISAEDKAKKSIITSLESGNPVIVSMDPGYSLNRDPHQIVIHGYQENLQSLDLLTTDPVMQKSTHQQELVSWSRFSEYFRGRAIFVDDK